MHKLLLLPGFILILFSCSPKYDLVRKEAKKVDSPPGTIWLKDNIFMDETEITNIAWREFVAWNKKMCGSNSVAYTLSRPDTLVWRKTLSFCEPYVEYYHAHPSYNNFPVVGITKQQAESYCKWRTFVVNQKIYIDENKLKDFDIDTLVHFPIKYMYRLPTKAEWEYAASCGLDLEKYPYGFENLKFKSKKNYLNKIICNDTAHNKLAVYGHWNDNGLLAQNDKFGEANKFGFFNMPGNVAEMVNEDRIAKGGSFIHFLDSCKIGVDMPYAEPESWLGFRSACEKVEDILMDAREFLEFDYSPGIHYLSKNPVFNDSLYILTDSTFKIELKENYFSIYSNSFRFYKILNKVIAIDSSENIISFNMVFWPAIKSENIIYDESSSNRFSALMVDCQKKSRPGDIIILEDIRIKNKFNIITLPPVYIMLKE